MTTWGRAFKAAGVYIALTLVWCVIGGIFVFIGFYTASGSFVIDPYTLEFYMDWGRAAGSIVSIVIGYIIIALGAMATLFKIFSEVTAEETERRLGEAKQSAVEMS